MDILILGEAFKDMLQVIVVNEKLHHVSRNGRWGLCCQKFEVHQEHRLLAGVLVPASGRDSVEGS
jgi:hypothetical protein